ncbi:unnamed protein product [Cylindrotheca closterium]|uniref:Uncharacterized protein n=1 Tax=Cylindrotheca closterium TaxID=2856 RepID=A0AAD2FBZ7_9STRA|nr:unnamed protein product [Cylindrotheca closterium]
MAQSAFQAGNGAATTSAQNNVNEKPSTIKGSIYSDSQSERILRKGDLVRILDSTPTKPKLKNHIGNLGRIARSNPVEDPDALHPFLYDIDFILGGKVAGVERVDLQYTTAEAEGMIGNTKRKRKPNTSFVGIPKKKEPKKPTPPKKKTQTTKAGGKKRGATGSAGKGKGKKGKISKADVKVEYPGSSTTNLNMYERHRREFERCVGRIEKADTFQWFMGEVPPEYDEPDTTESDSVEKSGNVPIGENEIPASNVNVEVKQEFQTGNGESLTATTPAEAISTPVPVPSTPSAITEAMQKNKFKIRSPSNPPYNFEILRKRIARGRYVLDEEAIENKHHRAMVKRYLNSLGNTTGDERAKILKAKAKLDVLHPKAVDWDLFRTDIIGMCDTSEKRDMECDDGSSGTISYACKKIKEMMEKVYENTGKKQLNEIRAANTRHRFASAIQSCSNNEAAVQGRWRKEAFPYRSYERLKTDVVCAGLSDLDERIAIYELKTSLKDSFVGLSYMFDDTEKSEAWMKSILNESGDRKQQRMIASALKSDNGVIKAQVEATIQSLLIAVQDRVMTDLKVLEQPELRNASWMTNAEEVPNEILSHGIGNFGKAPQIVEQPVWGIDCYTRRNVSICLETAIDADTALVFVEKWLLPAINACPVEIAHNITNAARILEGLPFESDPSVEGSSISMEEWRESLLGKALLNKIAESGPPWLKYAAQVLRKACDTVGSDFFRVHPKGHGSIVLCPKLEANKLVTFYRGEVYPSWRWGEKMDAIATIQERKGLKPVLPDFFNMALERPMKDPRGYGLLFCDASRKSGYGSMLSHSCQPSCEVRVAAVNGELTLAMTTLREMSIGDELTFDYNAVTESLNEYRSAVCLCGHGRCRGSFLHFATADCYQQVLNRNSPIAVRLANLIKGCMKQVMSDDDQEVLKRHGFQTAAFGAVSVNRRSARRSMAEDLQLDSMDFVPIWLQTYVADTLRYIEYERRALPIALICNQLYPEDEAKNGDSARSTEVVQANSDDDDDKPIKGARPEPAFFFYSRTQKSHFVSLLMKDTKHENLAGIELKREVQRLASSHWKELSADEKGSWKKKARQQWVKNGGMEKAKLEQARLARLSKGKPKTKDKKGGIKEKPKAEKAKVDGKKAPKNDEQKPPPAKITFQAADAEGISAMEQRIQQLTQTLSRVGRVLDRHRESIIRQKNDQLLFSADNDSTAIAIRQLAHSPLSIMPDEHIVAWVWNHDDGVVKMLLKCIADETCVSPKLRKTVMDTASKHSSLEKFGCPWVQDFKPSEEAMSPPEGRKRLNSALMELRSNILDGIDEMAAEIKRHKVSSKKEAARKKKVDAERKEIKAVMNDLINEVEIRVAGMPESSSQILDDDVEMNESEDTSTEEWMLNFNKRFKLEKAADILLMYSRTSTFFALNAYQPLQSSPVEVYARELGNAVPTSAIDIPNRHGSDKQDVGATGVSKNTKCGLCEPDDIIAEVAVEYQGDYVLSQLLQWYNAGIDQKPGLPDLLGCVMLPSLKDIWSIDGTQGSSSRTDRATGYKSIIRPRLVDWFKDPLKRGSPWPDDLRRAFVEKPHDNPISNASNLWKPIGSPVLDFLVTGDDVNINSILQNMGGHNANEAVMDSSGMLSSVDHGRPALAVSNWVQCENPDCLKWRKLPWHVDIDTLADKFYCKDNIWNPQSASCEAPVDVWDERTDGLVDADGSAPIAVPIAAPDEEVSEDSASDEDSTHGLEAADFKVGARFDVMNTAKSKWIVGVVVKIQDYKGRIEVKFHFLNHSVKYDEWMRVPSSKVAPLYSKTPEPPKRKEKKKQHNTSFNQTDNFDLDSSLADETNESVEHDGGTETIETNTTRFRPATVSDESSPIHSPSKENDDHAKPKQAEYNEMGDFSIYSSEDDENEPEASEAKRSGPKKLLPRKMKAPAEPEEKPSSSPKKGFKKLIPKKKTHRDDSLGSPLQSIDEDMKSKKRKKEKKSASTFKPLIPRKKSQDKDSVPNRGSLIPRKSPAKKEQGLTSLMKSENTGLHHATDGQTKSPSKPQRVNEKRQDPKTMAETSRNDWNPTVPSKKNHSEVAGELQSRVLSYHANDGRVKSPSKSHRAQEKRQDQKTMAETSRKDWSPTVPSKKHHPGLAGELQSRVLSYHANDSRAKSPNKSQRAHEKRQDPKTIPGTSRKVWDRTVASEHHYPEEASELQSWAFEQPRHNSAPISHSRRSMVDDEAGVIHEDSYGYTDGGRSHLMPPSEDNRGYLANGRSSVSSPDARPSRDIRRNSSFRDDGRSVRSRSRSRNSRDREYLRDYDRQAPRERSRRYDDYQRAPDTVSYSRDVDRVRSGDYDRDRDRDYGRSPSRRYDRDPSRPYDESYSRDHDSECKYSRDRDYYRTDRDYRGRADQDYVRDEGRDYAGRRYERDYDRYDDRGHRPRYDQEFVRDDDREYRRQYDRPRDSEVRKSSERQSDREYDRRYSRSRDREYGRGSSKSRDREHGRGSSKSRDREHSRSYREAGYIDDYERQRSSRSTAARIDSPSKRR